jgi:hypothetical protein
MKKVLYCLLLISLLFINITSLSAESDTGIETPESWKISEEDMTCEEILGSNLTKIVHLGVTAVKVVGAIAAILYGIIMFLPVIMDDDPKELNKALSKAIKMLIVLILILLLPTFIKIIGNIFDFDLTCLM